MQTTCAPACANSFSKKVYGGVIAVCVSVLFAASANAGSLLSTIQELSWDSKNAATLEALLPDRNKVTQFVRAQYGDVDVLPSVGEYMFVDLTGDGFLEFVATLDFSGREFYTTLLLIQQKGKRLVRQEIRTGSASIDHMRSRLDDLDNDNTQEILIPRLLDQYRGHLPVPVFTDVYAWDGSQYTQANDSHKDYYRETVLPKIKRGLEAVNTGHTTAGAEIQELLKKKYEVEIAAVEALVGK